MILLVSTFCTVACGEKNPPVEPGTDTTIPETIETIPSTEPVTDPETDAVTDPGQIGPVGPGPTVESVKFPAAALPDYAKYATVNRIKEVLGSRTTYAFAIKGAKYYLNGELKACDSDIFVTDREGVLSIDVTKLGSLLGKSDVTGTTPEEIAQSLGMGVAVYDNKLFLFYEGAEPLHTYEDMYTYEAMYLYMTDAAETEIVNAFIDLPSRISNDSNNTVFYTAPDLNLGIQTSVYYAQMGQVNNLSSAPALVAGEGKHEDNSTVIRIYNNQNTCTTQFMAFDASVKGGVQVAAAKVGNEVLIATAPFAAHDGKNGDVRVFDTFGLIRMTVSVRDVIPGPHTILTGKFAEETDDEVLLVASQSTNEKGELRYALISLSDGSLISEHTLNCDFALSEAQAGVPTEFSLRNNTSGVDTVILYFNSVQAVFEGDAQKAKFDNANITLPADALSVSASNVAGQKYIVALPEREGYENLSYVMVYGENGGEGQLLDIGFRENRFYSDQFLEYNDDLYVSRGDFCHMRVDLSNNAVITIGNFVGRNEKLGQYLDTVAYGKFRYTESDDYIGRLANEYMLFEPCFTHRWNKLPRTEALLSYVDAYGMQKFASIGKDDQPNDYVELDSSFYTGTYADGVLELAKIRIFPLRQFLQESAVAFRGENGTPEHLIGVSPVHEQEINIPGSVGDYNPYFIEGFRGYLLDRYGSLEAINQKFGTNFTDRASIDPPRNGVRGDWDLYEGEYFTEWQMYNRYIVSKRLMEAYREALLAGYPPESISAHQIPEGEAVAGFLGEADTRLTPIDVVLTCGTAYGGTRYTVVPERNNLAYNAHLMGHSNITLGEYGSRSSDKQKVYKQLKMYWSNGVRLVNQIYGDDPGEPVAEEYAVLRLQAENLPRPGYTGGTFNSMTVTRGGKTYNIMQIGDTENTGLLKSVDENGKWEGTVYLVPFHAHVSTSAIDALQAPVEGTKNVFATGLLNTIKNSDQAEITFTAAKVGDAAAWVTIEVYHDGCLLKDSVTTYQLTETMTPYRYVLSNQLYEDDLEIKITFHTEAGDGSMDSIKVENLYGTLQTERVGFTYYDGAAANRKSKAHEGGVTFDILDR